MYLKKLQIKNFKSFQDITIEFNKDINILTGVNNAGKTTMLEAIALWHECFSKLIQQAKTSPSSGNYFKGDYILGSSSNKYFSHHEINSVRAPNFEDIFYYRNKNNIIELCATFESNKNQELNMNFQIKKWGLNYNIELINNKPYDYFLFNRFFERFPNPIGCYYASPVSAIGQKENFVTHPQIQNAILNRQSASVFRNRLYNLYNSRSESLFSYFVDTLNYVLFNYKQKIILNSDSHHYKTVDVIFNFKIGEKDTEKDISLLGSGALQVMEILLNFYYPDNEQKDCNLILLDEPDSHIHRDIQKRLLQTITKFTGNTQIFLSTHNEALIRSASLAHLFHLEAKSVNTSYRSLEHQNLKKQYPHFKGMYPALTNPIISSLGYSNGLDFINAIESDYVIFVEGEDDARVIDILLREGQINNCKRYSYWVLNGITHIFKEINHYETVFSSIKNEKTLWEKSVLIFDRDYLDDLLLNKVYERLNKKINTHIFKSYTLESVIFTDRDKLQLLISKWLKVNGFQPDLNKIKHELEEQYKLIKSDLENEYLKGNFYKDTAYRHSNYRDELDKVFTEKGINISDIALMDNLRKHIEDCLSKGEYYKLMDKNNVATIINNIAKVYNFSYETKDFVSLIQCVDKSTWFDEWNFLLSI